ncbi:hypothetical protein BU15DRAFT_62175 [Melanogaster broomeanus]|nr:hypothetical protein BU15DRAFT_62175 [Melanogaster broomeanus]
MFSPGGLENLHDLKFKLIRGACQRRDIWASREGTFRCAWEQAGIRDAACLGSLPGDRSTVLRCSKEQLFDMRIFAEALTKDTPGSKAPVGAVGWRRPCMFLRRGSVIIIDDDKDYMGGTLGNHKSSTVTGRNILQHFPRKLGEVLLNVLCTLTTATAVFKL